MRCLRIYATPDGESHFDEIDTPTARRLAIPGTAPFEISARYPASDIRFTAIPAAMREVGYHTVPERVLTVRLDGAWSTRPAMARYGMLRPAALCWWRTRTEKATSPAIPPRHKP